MPEGRTVVVVVVDHDGGAMTLSCLRALAATEWSGRLRVVVVDNASQRPLDPAEVAASGAELVPAGANLGFAGGVNLGLRHAGVGRPGGPELVALVNNDAFVTPGWLGPLVAALDADPAVGAAQPKLLFEPLFAPVVVEATPVPQGRGPALGVRVEGPAGSVYGPGFDAIRPGEWWTTAPAATLFVPAAGGPGTGKGPTAAADDAPAAAGARVTLTVTGAAGGGPVRVAGGPVPGAGPGPVAVEVALPDERVSVVQNAGNELTAGLRARDRGAREPDDGRHDGAGDVWGWCGGVVLLRAAYLADAGWMDERLFLYWEDVDLSWRGLRRGWRYRYEPASVVRHRHGASMGALHPRFDVLDQRNRLVVLARHAGARPAARAWARLAAEAAWFAWRDLRMPGPDGRRSLRRTGVRLRALAGAVPLAVRRPAGSPGR